MSQETDILRNDILKAMTEIEDPKYRITLALVLRIMDTNERFIHQLFEKVDTLVQDEKRLQNIVLNGHVTHHSLHHNWIADRIVEEKENHLKNKTFARVSFERMVWLSIVFILGLSFQGLIHYLRGENGYSIVPHAHPSTGFEPDR